MSEGTNDGQPYQPPAQPGYQPPAQQPLAQQPPAQPYQPPPAQPGYQPPAQQPPAQPGYQQPAYQQQPHQQQPYYQPPPGATAPPKKGGMPTWLKVLLILGLPMLLIGGCIGGVFLLAKGPIDRTNNFLAAVQSGDFDTAFELTNPSCGIASTPAELESNFDGFVISGYSISGVQNNNGNVTTSGTVVLNGTSRDAVFTHLDDQICGYDIDPN